MIHFKYYLHNDYEFSEIIEDLESQGVPDRLIETIAGKVRKRFYEIGFNCFYDPETGKMSVSVE